MLTILVSIVLVEMSFTNLKIMKNYLKSTMSQKRLNGLVILSTEKKC